MAALTVAGKPANLLFIYGFIAPYLLLHLLTLTLAYSAVSVKWLGESTWASGCV